MTEAKGGSGGWTVQTQAVLSIFLKSFETRERWTIFPFFVFAARKVFIHFPSEKGHCIERYTPTSFFFKAEANYLDFSHIFSLSQN